MKEISMRVLFLMLLCSLLVGCSMHGPSGRYLIPQGYTGRVRVYYGVASAPPLPMEDGRYLYVIPPSGEMQTSNELDERWHVPDEFFAVKGKQRIPLPDAALLNSPPQGLAIWGMGAGVETIKGVTSPTYGDFFVMTKKQYDAR